LSQPELLQQRANHKMIAISIVAATTPKIRAAGSLRL
jgi:hypothetical protein